MEVQSTAQTGSDVDLPELIQGLPAFSQSQGNLPFADDKLLLRNIRYGARSLSISI